ncbi:DUF7507 domain-containing protein, partial [Polynucleobacter sinensis]|uniref:DUF7507 domain-containing protein n=1 Tax=Polynucleobacter sinensis TaxID=1743157 RepID=UPI0012E893A5
PNLEISKNANATSIDSASDNIVYTISVENTGNTKLTGVTFTDPMAAGLDVQVEGPVGTWTSVGPASSAGLITVGVVEVGTTLNYRFTYDISQTDFDAIGRSSDGDIDNTVVATASETLGSESVLSASEEVEV